MPKFDVIYRCIKGELYKNLFKFKILRPSATPLSSEKIGGRRLIVSLTSYGRRVEKVAPYAILSLMRQSFKPNMIILWLDYDNWNEDNLPYSIKRLQKIGLKVKFCKDIRSYKKLIPCFNEFPDDLIFTVDDDIYYPSDMLEKVIEAHKNSPNSIICTRGYYLTLSNNKLLPYNDWTPIRAAHKSRYIFPTGGAGCLYRRELMYKDICEEDLFLKFAPTADDIWFFFMEFLNHTPIEILSISKRDTISIDSFYQHFHNGSNLMSMNCGECQNDIQFRALMDYYGLSDESFMRINDLQITE